MTAIAPAASEAEWYGAPADPSGWSGAGATIRGGRGGSAAGYRKTATGDDSWGVADRPQ